MEHSVRQSYVPWVFIVSPAVALGAVSLAQLSAVPEPSWLMLWGGMFLFSVLMIKQGRRVGLLLLGVSLGLSLMHMRMLTWQTHQLPPVWSNVSFQTNVFVDGLARPSPSGGWQVQARLLQSPSPVLDNMPVLLHFPTLESPKPGEQWHANIRLYGTTGQHNPAGIDFEAWLFSQGIMATGGVLSLDESSKVDGWHWQNIRWLAMDRLRAVLPPETGFLGLDLALVLGDGALITPEQWQVLRDTGTLHLAVVSGMHITLIAGLAWMLAVGLWRVFPSQRVPAYLVGSIAAFIAAVAFSILAGLTVPVQRALIMLLAVLLAVWLKRSLHPMLTLSWALLLVLLWDIASVMQVGFWLSFIATAILIWILALSNGRIIRLLAVHLGMSLLMAPFLMLFFNQVPTYSPLANLIASPVVELILVPLLLVSAIVSWIVPSWAMHLAHLADVVWEGLWQVLSDMATWSYAVWLLSPMALFSGLGAGEQRLTLLDMGKQPMVAIWQSEHGNYLIGTGSQVGRQHTMESIILPSLTRLGINEVAGVLLTADDAQAMVGLTLLEHRLQVHQVLSGQDCSGDAQAWQWKQHSDQCWLNLTSKLALTWQMPNQQHEQAEYIVAPAPNTKLIEQNRVILWLSPNQPAHDSWAKTVKGTRCSGAMTLSIKGQDVRLVQEYRLSDKRFYHGDCQ